MNTRKFVVDAQGRVISEEIEGLKDTTTFDDDGTAHREITRTNQKGVTTFKKEDITFNSFGKSTNRHYVDVDKNIVTDRITEYDAEGRMINNAIIENGITKLDINCRYFSLGDSIGTTGVISIDEISHIITKEYLDKFGHPYCEIGISGMDIAYKLIRRFENRPDGRIEYAEYIDYDDPSDSYISHWEYDDENNIEKFWTEGRSCTSYTKYNDSNKAISEKLVYSNDGENRVAEYITDSEYDSHNNLIKKTQRVKYPNGEKPNTEPEVIYTAEFEYL